MALMIGLKVAGNWVMPMTSSSRAARASTVSAISVATTHSASLRITAAASRRLVARRP